MNRNTVIAFILILGTVLFFNSELYYKYILRRPYPYSQQPTPEQTTADSLAVSDSVGSGSEERAAEPTAMEAAPSAGSVAEVEDEEQADTTAVSGVGDTVWVHTGKMHVGITEAGGRIVSVRMATYAYRENAIHDGADSLIELIPPGGGGAGLSIDGHSLDSVVFRCEQEEVMLSEGDDSVAVPLVGTWEGREIQKVFRFSFDGYAIGMTVESTALAGRNVGVDWSGGIAESEWTKDGRAIQTDPRKAHVFDGRDVEHIQLKKPLKEEHSGTYRWVALTSKYFLVALMSEDGGDADVRVQAFPDTLTEALPKLGNYNYAVSVTRLSGETTSHYRLYTGPMRLHLLRAENSGLQRVLFRGWPLFFFADKWFPPLCELMLRVLLFLGKIFGDYGVAIVLLTIAVKAVTYPLAQSSVKSMARMRDLQPKVNAIRNRYKSDARKMNEELMELYRKEGVNPFNPGCLPMFLQMPILISLYVVLRKAIELRGAVTVLISWVKDLSLEEVLIRLPFDIPFYGDNFALMPIIMGIVTFVQNKKTMKDPNQAAMVYVMPVMMLVLFNRFPSGLVLYWTLSSAIGLGQQVLTERRQKAEAEAKAAVTPVVVRSGRKKRKG